jgi:hypothetical protein
VVTRRRESARRPGPALGLGEPASDTPSPRPRAERGERSARLLLLLRGSRDGRQLDAVQIKIPPGQVSRSDLGVYDHDEAVSRGGS